MSRSLAGSAPAAATPGRGAQGGRAAGATSTEQAGHWADATRPEWMTDTVQVPRVSVVVPTCGRPALLLRLMRALCRQSLGRDAFEVIVVDDGRCDATRSAVQALLRSEPSLRLRYLRPPLARQGPARARNLGWLAAGAPLVAFTDDDTVPAADWLERGARALETSPCAALAGRVVVPVLDRVPTDHERVTRGLERTEFITANAFVRRDALQRVGGVDERFTRAWREDSDLQFRLIDQAGPVGRCEDAVVLHPVRPERWGVSLRQQRNAFFEALLHAKHPRRYRERIGLPTPWDFYAIVASSLGALSLWAASAAQSAALLAAVAALLVLRFAARRLSGTSHAPGHVLEMVVTSAIIPFQSVYWRLRGALHFRTWFL